MHADSRHLWNTQSIYSALRCDSVCGTSFRWNKTAIISAIPCDVVPAGNFLVANGQSRHQPPICIRSCRCSQALRPCQGPHDAWPSQWNPDKIANHKLRWSNFVPMGWSAHVRWPMVTMTKRNLSIRCPHVCTEWVASAGARNSMLFNDNQKAHRYKFIDLIVVGPPTGRRHYSHLPVCCSDVVRQLLSTALTNRSVAL